MTVTRTVDRRGRPAAAATRSLPAVRGTGTPGLLVAAAGVANHDDSDLKPRAGAGKTRLRVTQAAAAQRLGCPSHGLGLRRHESESPDSELASELQVPGSEVICHCRPPAPSRNLNRHGAWAAAAAVTEAGGQCDNVIILVTITLPGRGRESALRRMCQCHCVGQMCRTVAHWHPAWARICLTGGPVLPSPAKQGPQLPVSRVRKTN